VKKLLAVVLCLAFGSVFFTCSASVAAPSQVYNIKLAGQFPVDNPASIAMEAVKKECEEKSGGRLIIQTFPANQLGDTTLVSQGIMDGSIEMGLLYNGGEYDPMIEINSLPYLTTDLASIKKVYSPGSNYFKIYTAIFEKLNMKILGIHVDGLIGIHGIKFPKDYKDFTKPKETMLRIPASDIYMQTTKDMGFPSVTIPFADLYTALQTGVCDAAIGQTSIGAYTAFRDVDKYFIPYRAFVETYDYMINADFWNSLPQDLQQILQDSVNHAVLKQNEDVMENEEKYSKLLAEKGVEILQITDGERKEMESYIRKVTWPKLYEKFGKEVLDQILADIK
jgi:TRAP-type C4-dicarboxylate transport system substrate-binding protein